MKVQVIKIPALRYTQALFPLHPVSLIFGRQKCSIPFPNITTELYDYLPTKIEDGQTHHFRATVFDFGVTVVEGVFYNWLSDYSSGCGTREAAIAEQQALVIEKLAEGFIETDFVEMPENTLSVYDKAKWHYEGNFPEDLDSDPGFVHTGLYLGWLIDNDLVSAEFTEDHEEAIEQFKQRTLTGPQFFERCCDGVLTIEDLSEQGNRFSFSYFDFETGQYLEDYEQVLCASLPSMYHVNDDWQNYALIKQAIDDRYAAWVRETLQ